MQYSEFAPTAFDSHIHVEDREDWIVAPCTITRDSEPLSVSNFESCQKILDDHGAEYEIHRFGHWGPGWFEIILVDPAYADIVEDIARALEDYPVLDDEDISAREADAEQEDWDNYGAWDFRKDVQSHLENCWDDFEDLASPYRVSAYCQHHGLPAELCTCGDCVYTIEQAIKDAIDALDDSDKIEELRQEFVGTEYTGDSTRFVYDLDTDDLLEILVG